MERASRIDIVSYSRILEDFGIEYEELKYWIKAGNPDFDNKWVLLVSIRANQGSEVLKCILPILKEESVAFRLIKNELLHYQLNGGYFGINEFARALTIFCKSDAHCREIASSLLNLTETFTGPDIFGALQVGNIVYVVLSKIMKEDQDGNAEIHFLKPKLRNLPFKAPQKQFKKERKQKHLIGGKYLVVKTMRFDPKGNIYKAIHPKFLGLEFCIIKTGKAYHNDDPSGRDIRERLKWQAKVLKDVESNLRVSKLINLIRERNDYYLVLEYIEGISLERKIAETKGDQHWDQLGTDDVTVLLNYYLKTVNLVEKLHICGYVHRDITPANFIIMENKELCILDFELSFSLKEQEPNPPFALGTIGFVSPEQMLLSYPTVKEDIYSLGVVLLFMVIGELPGQFFENHKDNYVEEINTRVRNNNISELILKCINESPTQRPAIGEIRTSVFEIILNLK